MSDLNGGMAAGYALKELFSRPAASEGDGTGVHLLPMQRGIAAMKEQFACSAAVVPTTPGRGWRPGLAAALRHLAEQLEPERGYAHEPTWSSGT